MAANAAAAAVAAMEREKTLQEELALPILLTDRVLKSADEAESNRSECVDIARQVDRISQMLRAAVRLTGSTSPAIYDRPIRRIAGDVSKNLERALTLVRKCKHTGILRHVFLTITSSAADFKKVSNLLESSIADLKWLLSIYDSDEDGAKLTIPPIASNDPILAWVWSCIASLQTNRLAKERVESANCLASLACDNQRYRKVIVEEGAVPPLLRLLKDGGGSAEGQIAAAKALSCLADDVERTRVIAAELGIGIIVQVLGDSPMKVQAPVADLVAKIAEVDPMAREEFGRENVLKPLVSCLIMDLDLEDYKRIHSSGGKTSIHSIVQKELAAKSHHNHIYGSNSNSYHKVQSSSSFSSMDGRGSGQNSKKERENASPELKHRLKTNCSLALRRLCEGSLRNSQKIAEPKGLFCLSKIIETEKGDLQYNCLMTIVEVAEVAEDNADLRKVAWKPSSPPAKAVLDQLLRVIKEESNPDFQIHAIKAIGCLSRIFSSKETGIISALVAHLGNPNTNVATEAAVALTKFTRPENHNCAAHSKTIIECNGVPLLMKMLSASDRAKKNGLVLLCYLSMHVGNSKALAEARALRTLESAIRSGVAQSPESREIFSRAVHQLMLYQDGDHPHSQSYAIV